MNIPQGFRDTIAQKFYDKTIDVYSTTNTVDSTGWAAKSGTSIVVDTFKGNIRFNKLDILRESYGIKEDIHAAITTAENVPLNTIIGYLGRQYKVITSIPFDSHYLILAQKWLSKSSTSISV